MDEPEPDPEPTRTPVETEPGPAQTTLFPSPVRILYD